MLRIILRCERQKYNEQELAIFLRLEGHAREIQERNTNQADRIALSAKAVKEYSGTSLKEETICEIGRKVRIYMDI